jgi:hypothetical protein
MSNQTLSKIDSYLLAWLTGRIGYGRLDAPAWYIGTEEACGDKKDLELRLGINSIIPEDSLLEDVKIAHARLPGGNSWFAPNAPLQPTWNRLIRAHLTATGNNTPTRQDCRDAQQNWWGQTDVLLHQKVLLTELLPLPCPNGSNTAWKNLYGGTGLPHMEDRPGYEAPWEPLRRTFFQNLVTRHRPKWVVAYGKKASLATTRLVGTHDSWQTITVNTKVWGHITKVDGTIFVRAPHPVAPRGYGFAGWEQMGTMIRSLVSQNP